MDRNILSIDDLYAFFVKQNKNQTFSSNDEGFNICVSSKGTFTKESSDDSEGLMYCKVRAFHDLTNQNKSKIDPEVFKEKLQTMKDRPIMADIVTHGDGTKDFSGHTMELDEKTKKIVYIEKPIGHFVNPEGFHTEFDEEYDRTFAVADCVIYEEYSDACDILRERETVECSVELSIRDMSFDCEEQVLIINDFYVQGCCLLGADVKPGMKGSKLTLKDFSEENNSVFSLSENNKLIETLDKLNNTLSKFEIENTTRKEDELVAMKTNNDLNVTEEEVVENFDEVTEKATTEDEVTEVETTDETPEDVVFDEDDEPEDVEPEDESDAEPQDDEGDEEDEEEVPTSDEVIDDDEQEVPTKKVEYTATIDGETKTFSVSLNDKLYGMSCLINSTYGEEDCEYYSVTVYEDEKVVEFVGWDHAYRQSFEVEGDEYVLVGEREEIFAKYLTQAEIDALDILRTKAEKLDEVEEKLAKYEEEPEKIKVLESEDYAQISEMPEFVELKKRENYFELSVEDITKKCDAILLSYAKNNKLGFSKEENKEPEKKPAMFAFARVEHNSSFLDGLLNK